MKGVDIYKQLDKIDSDLIMESEETFYKKNPGKRRLITVLAVAACVCIMLIPLGIFMRSRLSLPAPEPMTTTGADDPLPQDYTDFVIDGGRLLSYTGAETNVVVPDEVTEVTAEAFANAPAATKIETIRLGANTSHIETSAFVGLFALDSVEVSENNDSFRTEDGMLFSTDGTLVFTLEKEKDINETLYTLIHNILGGAVPSEMVSRIVVGGAVIDVNVSYDSENTAEPYDCVVTAIHAYGQTVEFEVPLELKQSLYSMNVIDYNGQFIAWYNFLTGDEDSVSGYEMCILSKSGVYTYRRGYELYHVTEMTYFDLPGVLNEKRESGEEIPDRVALVFDDINNFSIIARVSYDEEGKIYLTAEKAYAFYRVFSFDRLPQKVIIESDLFDIFYTDDVIAIGVRYDQGMFYSFL